MALITRDKLKLYLRIENNVEDTLVDDLIAEAVGKIETFLGRAIVDRAGVAFGEVTRYPYARSARYDGADAVASGTTSVSTALSLLPDYTTRLEYVVNAIIRDIVADAYQHRNPSSSAESTAGSSTSYDTTTGLPKRALPFLRRFRVGATE